MASVDSGGEERRRQRAVRAARVFGHRLTPEPRANAQLDARLVDRRHHQVEVGQVVPPHHLEYVHGKHVHGEHVCTRQVVTK